MADKETRNKKLQQMNLNQLKHELEACEFSQQELPASEKLFNHALELKIL